MSSRWLPSRCTGDNCSIRSRPDLLALHQGLLHGIAFINRDFEYLSLRKGFDDAYYLWSKSITQKIGSWYHMNDLTEFMLVNIVMQNISKQWQFTTMDWVVDSHDENNLISAYLAKILIEILGLPQGQQTLIYRTHALREVRM